MDSQIADGLLVFSFIGWIIGLIIFYHVIKAAVRNGVSGALRDTKVEETVKNLQAYASHTDRLIGEIMLLVQQSRKQ